MVILTDFDLVEIPNENLSCLRSLFLSNPRDDLAAIRSTKGDRVDGTCEWILTQDRYTSWLVEDSPQLLWLSGAPGIGKTMLSSFLVEEIAQLAEQSSQMTVAYYFCDDKYQERRTVTAILRGLLLQLLRQRPILFKHIQSDFDMCRDSLCTNFHALWRTFVSIVQDPEAGEVYCLIDALDECEKESRQLFLTEFTKLFRSQQSKKIHVKFIVTSRRESDIQMALSAVSPIIRDLQVDSGRVNDDLSKFIDVKVDELSAEKRYSAGLKDKIKFDLMEKAGGTFLYVSLVLHDLKKTRITSQVRQKLQELPPDLNKVYDRILGQIDVDCEEIAKLVLRWVAVAPRPLTMDELAMVCALGTGEWERNTMPTKDTLYELRDGFQCCEPLVYVTGNDTINLVHQSAKDYLLGAHLQGRDGLSQYHIVPESTNLLMFKTCWKYLSLEEFKQGTVVIERGGDHRLGKSYLDKPFLDDHCLLRYASKEWLKHALLASPALATDYEFSKDMLDRAPTLRDFWLLEVAAKGQEAVVQRLLEDGAELESQSEYGRTPLLLAAQRGHEGVVKLLLSRDDVAVNSPDLWDQTPLWWASKLGHEEVVKLLLSRGDMAVNSHDKRGLTPLLWAAENGYEGVVKLLLSRDDVAVNSHDKRSRTPLLWAAQAGHEGVVKLLLSRDVAVNSHDEWGRTPMLWAARNGHEGVVKLLLSRDVAVNSHDEWGRTPMLWAARNGHEGVVKLLLSRDDVAVNPREQNGRTPLWYATKKGYDRVVKLLKQKRRIMKPGRGHFG